MSTDSELRELIKDMPRFLEMRDKAVTLGGWSEYSEIVFSRDWVGNDVEAVEPETDETVLNWLEGK